jgi:hypothetical protein
VRTGAFVIPAQAGIQRLESVVPAKAGTVFVMPAKAGTVFVMPAKAGIQFFFSRSGSALTRG